MMASWSRAFAISLLFPAALCGVAASALAQSRPEVKEIYLNAGEVYVIRNVAPGTTPEVRFRSNPPAFLVDTLDGGMLQVVATSRGAGSVRVTDQTGKVIDYEFIVQGVADPTNVLAPGTSSPPLSVTAVAPYGAGEATASSARSLDAGAGPVTHYARPGDFSTATSTVEIPATHPESKPTNVAREDKNKGAVNGPNQPLLIGQQGLSPSVVSNGKYIANPPALPPSRSAETCTARSDGLPCGLISLITGTSRVFSFGVPITRVSIANPQVSDIQLVSPNQLMLIGGQPGVTTLAVWNALGQLQERKVRVEKESHEQVLLNVLVAEVNRTKLENEGVDLSVAGAGTSLVGLPGNVATPYSPIIPLNIFPTFGPSPLTGVAAPPTPLGLQGTMTPGGTLMPLLLSNKITYALATSNGGFQSNSFFQFLESHQLAKILAQPRILANSGEEAKFLSGGEIPIVIAQALNTSIVFKQFGTSVVFIPTVVGDDEIELVVKPEVSQPDYSQGVQMFGFNVPAFITQRAETQVRMKNNETLIIAGLIQENVQRTVTKVPYMGDIPFAGALFRNTSYNRVKTELVITVTPQLVRAIPQGAQVARPTDSASMTYQEIRTRSLPQPDPSRPRLW